MLSIETIYKLSNGRYYSEYPTAVAEAKKLAKGAGKPFNKETAILSVDMLVFANPTEGTRKFFHLLPAVPRVDSSPDEDPGFGFAHTTTGEVVTTIAAMVDDDGTIVLGADSAVTGEFINILKRGKIQAVGELAIAWCGISAPSVEFTPQAATVAGARALAQEIVSALQGSGHGANDGDGVMAYPISGIIAGPGCGPIVFTSTGEILEYDAPFVVGGSGGAIALGAMAAMLLEDPPPDATDCVRTAIELAAEFDPHTRVPVQLVVFPPPDYLE